MRNKCPQHKKSSVFYRGRCVKCYRAAMALKKQGFTDDQLVMKGYLEPKRPRGRKPVAKPLKLR